ncbi:MAG: 3-deoxy-D-manno-octulosonic acid transferase, partial [Kiloniellaceae bacterium]
GELGLWYRLGEIAFVGGSLVPKGGQNMVEPIKLGCAVLCGPHTANFMRVTSEMTRAGALGQVADGSELAAAVGALMSDAAARRAMIEAGRAYAAAQAGVLDDIVAALAPLLDRTRP